MHIGLIGVIGPAAQDYYTRQLIGHFSHAGVGLDLTTAHGDAPTLLANLAADRRAQQAAIFVRLTERLARAGAEFPDFINTRGLQGLSHLARQRPAEMRR